MMVTVDEARQHHLVAAADDGHVWVLATKFLIGADLDDRAVFLHYGAIRHLIPAVAINRMRHHGATADQRCAHVMPPPKLRAPVVGDVDPPRNPAVALGGILSDPVEA